jgi:hypothetical protein
MIDKCGYYFAIMLKAFLNNKTHKQFIILTLVLAGLLTLPALSRSIDLDFPNISDTGRFNLGVKDDLAALSFENQTSATPYVGAGVGQAGPVDKFHATQYEQTSETGLVDMEYKIGFGMDFRLDKNTGLTLGYQWDTGTTSEILGSGIGSLSPDQENQHISVGIKVKF